LHEEWVFEGVAAVNGDVDRAWGLNLDFAFKCPVVHHRYEEECPFLLLHEAEVVLGHTSDQLLSACDCWRHLRDWVGHPWTENIVGLGVFGFAESDLLQGGDIEIEHVQWAHKASLDDGRRLGRWVWTLACVSNPEMNSLRLTWHELNLRELLVNL